MEDKLNSNIKRDLMFTLIIFAIFLILQLCFCVYAVSVFVNYKSSAWIEIIISVIALVEFCVIDIIEIVKDIIPLTKDYKLKQIEKFRARVVAIRSTPRFSYEIVVKSIENDREMSFKISIKDVDLYKVYDFWYAKYSKHVCYALVTDEELTEANREKAGKIDLNRKD